ncbi:hypothetical protein SLS54_004488 [Diplodia seriata]
MNLLAIALLATSIFALYLSNVPSQPTSIPATTTTTITTPNFTLASLYALQTRIFDQTLSLAPVINSTLLSPSIRGRVDITRTFTGIELNTEYLFSLFAQLNRTRSFTLLGIPTGYTVTHFAAFPLSPSPSSSSSSDAAPAAVAASAILMNFTSPTFWHAPFTLEIHAWTLFDGAGRARQYDATFRHWGAFVSGALSRVARARFGGNVTAAVAHATTQIARAVCAEHEAHCTTGKNRQYASEAACVAFLAGGAVRFGGADEMGLDTLLCRMVHGPMVALRPAVHCPHVGPSGGDMCTDRLEYGERIDQGFWEVPWIPAGAFGEAGGKGRDNREVRGWDDRMEVVGAV